MYVMSLELQISQCILFSTMVLKFLIHLSLNSTMFAVNIRIELFDSLTQFVYFVRIPSFGSFCYTLLKMTRNLGPIHIFTNACACNEAEKTNEH